MYIPRETKLEITLKVHYVSICPTKPTFPHGHSYKLLKASYTRSHLGED